MAPGADPIENLGVWRKLTSSRRKYFQTLKQRCAVRRPTESTKDERNEDRRYGEDKVGDGP